MPGAITFSEFPVGTHITNQYTDEGLAFGGDNPFITTDGANPTSPVLSGSPRFHGAIEIRVVDPGSGEPTTANGLMVDVGYIDNANSVELEYFAIDGVKLGAARANALGINSIHLQVAGIAKVSVHAVLDEPAGFAIDNVALNPNTASVDVRGMASVGDSYTSGEGLLPETGLFYDCGTDLPLSTYYENTNVGPGAAPPYCDTVTRVSPPPPDFVERPFAVYENKCHRHGRAWVNQVRGSLGVAGDDALFVACSGATTSNVGYRDDEADNTARHPLSPNSVAGRNTQAADVAAFDAKPGGPPIDFITVGVGGNDAGFAEIVKFCMRHECLHDDVRATFASDTLSKINNTVFPNLVDTFENVRATYPGAVLLAYGYPSIVDPAIEPCAGLRFRPIYELDAEERAWAQGTLLPALNQAIADAAATAGVTFMPVDQVTKGHEICTKDPWINGLRPGDDEFFGLIGNESFHPTQRAHDAIADYFLAHYTDGHGNLTFSNPEPNPTIPPSRVTPAINLGTVVGQPFGQCGVKCIQPACSPVSCQIDLNLSNFSPDVVLEVVVNSDPVVLGTLTTDAHGNTHGTFDLPDTMPDGLHFVTVSGVDANQVSQIGETEFLLERKALAFPKLHATSQPAEPPPAVTAPVISVPEATPAGLPAETPLSVPTAQPATLPRTGAPIGLQLLMAATLLGCGIGMSRSSRYRPQHALARRGRRRPV